MPAVRTDLFAELRERIAEVVDLGQIGAVLGWDQETMMPPKGAQFRATQSATLAGLWHERFTSPRVGELLTELEKPDNQRDLSVEEASIIRVLRRDYDRATKLPGALVRDLAIATTEGVETWRRAREESRWETFAPDLKRIVDLKRQQARYIGYTESPYDALLDEYEPGATTRQLIAVFDELRRETVNLLSKIDRSGRSLDRAIVEKPYAGAQQLRFTEVILRKMGFDFSAGRQDLSTHPFTTSFGPTDVRVTTRLDENDLAVALYASIHEGGHALYDQGIPVDLARTGAGEGASLGIHESQSRLWENFIGRSVAFWQYALPLLSAEFPNQLAGATPETLTAAVNRVERSLVRVEADEVTYNLHIILRFDIERRLIAGDVDVADLPALWNKLMQDYLGVTPPNDRLGVLQDIHWSGGMIGYFPTYSLGNLYAAQLWYALHRQYPDLDEQLARGEFGIVLDWLRERIHRWGRLYRPNELIVRATGEELSPRYLVQYLNEKYGRLYGF